MTALKWLPNRDLTMFLDATVQARCATVQTTEEEIVNALVAADTRVAINGKTVPALPTDQLRAILAKCDRLVQ